MSKHYYLSDVLPPYRQTKKNAMEYNPLNFDRVIKDPERFHVEEPGTTDLQRPLLNAYTTLRIDSIVSLSDCVAVLSCATSLVHCRFGNISEVAHRVLPAGRALVPVLQCLHVSPLTDFKNREGRRRREPPARPSTNTFLCELLSRIETPMLRHLSVRCNANWQHAPFADFLRASRCELKALEFIDVRMSDDELLDTLRLLPQLTLLKFHAYKPLDAPASGSRTLMKSLWDRNPDTGERLIPLLHTISFNDWALKGIPKGDLGEMISTRIMLPPDERILTYIWLAVDCMASQHLDGEKEIIRNVLMDQECGAARIGKNFPGWGRHVRETTWTQDERFVNDVVLGWKRDEPGYKIYHAFSNLSLEYP